MCVWGHVCGGGDAGRKGFTLLLSTESLLDSTGGWVVASWGGGPSPYLIISVSPMIFHTRFPGPRGIGQAGIII